MISVEGLAHDEQNVLDQLLAVWQSKVQRNRLRKQYYDQKNVLKDLGISIPPDLVNLELVLGWPAKAVDLLALRCRPDKFVIPGREVADLGIAELWRENDMDVELPQAVKSGLMYAPTFMATSLGDVQSGEPKVLISSRSAMYSAALWDSNRRAVSAALGISTTDDGGWPTSMTVWLPHETLILTRGTRWWHVDRRPHSLGRVAVEALAYKPSLDRPFGSSRISRAVMGISDSALRTAVRTEVSAEFFSSPQRWMMGADEKMFVDKDGNPKSAWQSVIGRIWAAPPISDDEGYTEGKLPQVGEFRSSPQTPNTDQMRSLATQFAGETSLPVSSLGVIQDNPSSADAMLAAERDLVLEAKAHVHEMMGPRIERTMLTAMQIRDNLDEIPSDLWALSFEWKSAETMTESAAADAVTKVIGAIPELGQSKVMLERLGWDDTTVERAWSDIQRARGGGALGAILAAQQSTEPGGMAAEDAMAQKAKFDALGVAIRAGVDPVDAAARLGLDGIKFTGAIPTSLRPLETDAVRLEGQ